MFQFVSIQYHIAPQQLIIVPPQLNSVPQWLIIAPRQILHFQCIFHISFRIQPKCALTVKYSTQTVDHSTPTVNYCTPMGKYLSWFFQYGTLSQLMMKETSVITCVPWQWTPSKKQQAIPLKGKIRQYTCPKISWISSRGTSGLRSSFQYLRLFHQHLHRQVPAWSL